MTGRENLTNHDELVFYNDVNELFEDLVDKKNDRQD